VEGFDLFYFISQRKKEKGKRIKSLKPEQREVLMQPNLSQRQVAFGEKKSIFLCIFWRLLVLP